MGTRRLISVILVALHLRNSFAARCELFPSSKEEGPEFGLVFIPGAQIKGEAYGPLALKIQEMFPGKLWVGLTEGWLADFPNPVEIAGAINNCIADARDFGLNADRTFMAGHSLGGIFLEMYINDHADLSAGLLLFGSYLPDLFGDEDNAFPVPVLTAVGTIDGPTISYVLRENDESLLAGKEDPYRYPVVAVEQCNHAQVASGEMPQTVIEQDIDSEIDNDEAHNRYASAGVAFIITNYPDDFAEDVVAEQRQAMDAMRQGTEEFLEPFYQMRMLEDDGNNVTAWMLEGQKILLNASENEDLNNLNVTTELVLMGDLGPVKPKLDADNCMASVSTFSHPQYSANPLDFGTLISATVIKAKFKLEEVVLEGLCLPTRPEMQCKDINRAAYELALQMASPVARERLLSKGRQLTFTDDSVSPWGPGWEYSTGLKYTTIDETTVEIQATSLISPPDFLIPSAAGMHYCDLLSPYRALEWIYIAGVVHG